MSRIDDDRDAQRLLERIALKQREDARRVQERKAGDSAFAQKMQESTAASQRDVRQAEHHSSEEATLLDEQAHHVDEETLHETDAHARDAAHETKARSAGKAFERQLRKGETVGEERSRDGQLASGRQKGVLEQGRAVTEVRAKGRGEDAKGEEDRREQRGQASAKGGKLGAASARDGGDTKADADAGGQGGGGDKEKKDGPALGAGFRLNPALMAPVPVAQPKDTGSARMRALAQEIAQKIVERVRVGTNRDGAAEFQIDLKSSVLSGLSIKLSGSNGKIRALFSGGDKEVLKMLEEQAEGLRRALEGRGLRLEEFKVEARA